ncbi:MAG: nuclear transport factor 2 family protein, partial [Planctomycetes bacterium]|nr:nuclear transport factor 2 family protein [Planctomycetota bacterium]
MFRFTIALAAVACFTSTQPAPSAEAQVAAVLDDFHDAASKGDGVRYFSHFAPEAVFLGTDATERWTVAEFREYAHPHFGAGEGWTYVPHDRHVMLSENGTLAWVDEKLTNEKYGELRGTGVLRKIGRVLLGERYDSYHSPDERELDPNEIADALRTAGFDEVQLGYIDLSLIPIHYYLPTGPGAIMHVARAIDRLWCASPLARWSSAPRRCAR